MSAGLTDVSTTGLPLVPENNQVLALGLSEAKAGFNPLPKVPFEINAIVKSGTQDNLGIYNGKKFLNSAFDFRSLRDNLTGVRVLHLATHGEFVPETAM